MRKSEKCGRDTIVRIGNYYYSLGDFSDGRFFNCFKFVDKFGGVRADKESYVIEQTVKIKQLTPSKWEFEYFYKLV